MRNSLTPPLRLPVLEQAAAWFAVLRDSSASEADRQQWQTWLAAHPDHARAWAQVDAIGTPFARLAEAGDTTTVRGVLDQPRQPARQKIMRRHALKLLGFGGTALLAGWLGARQTTWPDWVTTFAVNTTTYRTAIGETRLVTLTDGTRLWINTASTVDVAYGAAVRRIRLRSGELLIETAPDSASPSRPLRVATIHGQITALGTRFSVQLEASFSTVAVFEGAVRVAPEDGATTHVLHSGEEIRFDRAGVQTPHSADPAREAWSRGILLADNRRLDDFIRELARYQHGELSVAPEVGQLRLVGAYPLANIPRILTAIQASLPVRIRQTGPKAWRVEAR